MIKILQSKKINCILLALAFSFNLFVFAPLEFYYSNVFDLWFNIDYILPLIIIAGVFVFISVLLITIFTKNRVHKIICKIVFLLTVSLYIQGNYLNIGYEVLNGNDVDWNSMIFKGIINTVIWIAILVIPFFIKLFDDEKIYRVIFNIICMLIILIQIFTLITVICIDYLSSNAHNKIINSSFYMDTSNIFNLSKNKNIVVFISDTFEGTYMNEILEKYPEFKEKLKDFIYFDNTTTASLMTYSSMPTLLTGEHLQIGNNLKENMNYCFENTNFYETLKQNEYDIELYTSLPLIPTNDKDLIKNKIEKKMIIDTNSKIKLTSLLYKCVFYRYMPHFLKSKFIVDTSEFNKINSTNVNSFYIDTVDDVAFNKQLINEGIESNSSKNQFKLYHLNGVHTPYYMTENIEYDRSKEYINLSTDERRLNQAVGSLNILLNYVENLKKSNLYDNTTIIFLADHGWQNRYWVNFMIKKANYNSNFSINHAPISTDTDLLPTILNIATNSKNYGKDIFDYTENENRIRNVYNYVFTRGDNTYNVLSRLTITTNEDASNYNSFYVSDYEYIDSETNPKKEYEFNKKININNSKNAKYAILNGFLMQNIRSVAKGTNIGQEANIKIKPKKTEEDVTATFLIDKVYFDNQKIIFSLEDTVLYEIELNEKDENREITFTIPKELWNKNDILNLKLKFPNAKLGNAENLGEETLFMSILLKEVKFSSNK